MSTRETNRWYILPPAETTQRSDGEQATIRTPKYTDQDGILGFSGTLVTKSEVSDSYAGLTRQYPDVDEWYLARVYGRRSALDSISIKSDTRNLATNMGDVGPVLDQRFPGIDRSGDEWNNGFRIGRQESGDLIGASEQ